MIRNIVFDMGNVLLDYNPRRPLEAFLGIENDRAIIQRELFEGKEWIAGDYGYITNQQRFNTVKERVPERLHDALYKCVNRWPDFLEEIYGAKEYVMRKKEQGFHVYILSNACSAFYEYFPKFLPLHFFDGIVVSSDIHMVKPEPGIYQYLLRTYGLKPSECLFIDDRQENVEGAVKAGMYGVVFCGDFNEVENYLVEVH
ncbi:MAG: HAD family phosphatase [Clostridium sp.]|nr:HAD family phosphatase [Clostridium sp.]